MINYYLITKPGIVLGNLLTIAAGFLLASRGDIDYWLFIATLMGLAFVMASACVFNNYIDRQIDKKMERTKNRVLVKGLISGKKAIVFAAFLGGLGAIVLFSFTNILTLLIAAIGFFVYVVLYSMWKGRTIYGTAIGSVAGGVPPLVGYCAVSNCLDAGALVFFMILILWQMPHFFSIALCHFEDYKKADIPVLPVKKGAYKTKQRMVIYIAGFIGASALLTFFNYTGYIYLVVAGTFGLSWFALTLKGFKSTSDERWARHMFRLSLAVITAICLVIPFDVT